MSDKIGYRSRGVKFADFQVLRETVDNCPSVLLELGFLSNEDESSYYSRLFSKKDIAFVIIEILLKF